MKETYTAARTRLLKELVGRDWKVAANLKTPHATKNGVQVFFHPQAVYLRGLSTWLDIRGMTVETFESEIMARDVALQEIGR